MWREKRERWFRGWNGSSCNETSITLTSNTKIIAIDAYIQAVLSLSSGVVDARSIPAAWPVPVGAAETGLKTCIGHKIGSQAPIGAQSARALEYSMSDDASGVV